MATTPQAISRVLRNADYTMSREYMGRICYMSTEGYYVRRDWRGNVYFAYTFRTGSSSRLNKVIELMEKEQEAVKFLQSRGYTVEKGERGWNVTKN